MQHYPFDSRNPIYRSKIGAVAEGESIAGAGQRLLQAVMEYAGGKPTASEKSGARGIAIWKDGVTL